MWSRIALMHFRQHSSLLPMASRAAFTARPDPIAVRSLTDRPTEVPKLVLPDDSVAKRLYKKLFSSVPKSKLRVSGLLMLSHCVDKVDLASFIRIFDLPDSFYTWFLVTELHVWMLSVRLMAEGTPEGRLVRNAMIDMLWKDCDRRAKLVGELPMKIRGQQICELSEEFQAAFLIYDDGLMGDDKDLANAVWRRFFLCGANPDAEKIEILVSYIRKTMSALDHIDLNTLVMTDAVKWLPIQDKA